MEVQPMSIIVISCRCDWELQWAIKGYEENSFRDDHQIIFVDNGSEDGSQERIKNSAFADDAILLDGNHGPFYALNRGLEAAKHEWIGLFFSDDMIPGWHWDKKMFEGIEDETSTYMPRLITPLPPIGDEYIVNGLSAWHNDGSFGNAPGNFDYEKMVEFTKNSPYEHYPKGWQLNWYGFPCVMHRSLYEKCGPWQEDPEHWLEHDAPGKDNRSEFNWGHRLRDNASASRISSRSLFFHFVSRRQGWQNRLQTTWNRMSKLSINWNAFGYADCKEWYEKCYLGI